MPNFNEQIRSDLMDAVAAGHTIFEMATLVGMSENYVSTLLTELVKKGKLERVGRGKYAVVQQAPAASHLAESTSRKVQLPDYMRTRASVTLFVERSPEEIEGVLRLELCIGGAWLPILVTGNLRLCTGDDIPRWSATQEVYSDVKAFRVTKRDGSQAEYAHNAAVPFTVDRKDVP